MSLIRLATTYMNTASKSKRGPTTKLERHPSTANMPPAATLRAEDGAGQAPRLLNRRSAIALARVLSLHLCFLCASTLRDTASLNMFFFFSSFIGKQWSL